MDKIINVKVNLDNEKLLSDLLQANALDKEIDFITKQLDKGCKTLNPIPIAKKYNLPYDSKLVNLLSLFEMQLKKD